MHHRIIVYCHQYSKNVTAGVGSNWNKSVSDVKLSLFVPTSSCRLCKFVSFVGSQTMWACIPSPQQPMNHRMPSPIRSTASPCVANAQPSLH